MRVFKYLAAHWRTILVIVVLLLIQAFCDLALPRYTAGIVDVGILQFGIEDISEGQAEQFARAIANQDYSALGFDPQQTQLNYLLSVGAQMLGITALGALAAIAISFLASRTAATIAHDLRQRLFERVVSFSDAEVQHFSAASLITRSTNDVQQIQQTCMIAMRMVLFAPMMAIGGIIMVLSTDVSMSWIIVLAIVVVIASIGTLMAIAMPKFKIMQTLIDKVNLVAREIITGLPVIRAFNRQDYEKKRFDEASTKLMRTQLFTTRTMTIMMPVVQLVMNGVSALIVWTAAGYIDAGVMQTGEMIAFINYATVIITSFMMMSMVAIMLPRADISAARIDEVLACHSSIQDPETPQDDALPTTGGAAIEFDQVTFAYDDASEPVLDDVSFTIAPGSSTAIVGATGSGKTTVLKLLMRFYDVCSGAVRVDGVDVRQVSQRALHKQFGYVPQHSYLFSGPIAETIGYAHEGIGEVGMERIAKTAQAMDFISEKEGGLSFELSQGGTNVSGGQRQRLAIARALAQPEARAFLFDDSFSALDYATDAALRRSLREDLAGKTVLIVAQRVATIRDCDKIIVLDGGRVVGQGTHAELLESCTVYKEIAQSQLSELELGGGAA